ncbi:MAG: hypothetical protein JW737_08420 [Acidobacteria bacterium]|nr:hypothetical protein [Acidobacteriota bacterium]
MDLQKSKKNWLEKVADAIPGLKSYREHEHRRDTDKRLRDYMAAQIDSVRDKTDELKLDLTNAGKLKLLDDIDRITAKLRKIADSTRHASYGYTGVFDQIKMRDEELDTLFRYDVEILDAIKGLMVDADTFVASEADEAAVKDFDKKVKAVDDIIQKRKQIFDEPKALPEGS